VRATAQRRKRNHPAAFAAQLERLGAFREGEQARTKPHARQDGARWTAEEDGYLLASLGRPLAEAAMALGRTWRATSTRRWVLRRRS
jgi:hypothetical protein